jgi:hypothetical protein
VLRIRLTTRSKAALVGAALFSLVAVGVSSALVWNSRAVSGKPTLRPHGSLRADFTRRLVERGQVELVPAAHTRFETLTAKVHGAAWSLSSYRNAKGELCLLEVVPGEGRGYGCGVGGAGPLNASWGSRQDPEARGQTTWDETWVEGVARPPVTKVELVLIDCSTINLPLTSEGAYFGVLGADAMHSGASPYLVQGLNAHGHVVGSDVAEFAPPTGADGVVGPPEKATPIVTCPAGVRRDR